MRGINIYYGVKTGCNEAFVIDNETKEALIKEDPRSEELLKPVLRGRNIRNYRPNWAGEWLIATHNGYGSIPPIDVNSYPAIKAHLDKHFADLENRQDKGVTTYNLRNCAYHAEFEREKIAFPGINRKWRFVLVGKGFFILAPMRFITASSCLNYIKAIFGSKVIQKYWSFAGLMQDDTGYQMDSYAVERLPIPPLTQTAQKPFIDLVDRISVAEKQGKSIAKYQKELNHAVYRLYSFSDAEIRIIES